ncbi:AAA family ATPase [Streptomyces nanshensis]|uniref:AAA family ATPase n=1 Tax=Streptomyces nanshensis TaxID=518642 RepID=UPI000A66B689|nr:LuxR family transcriptional regulator [Streptomyces nanshensis]
MTRESGDRTQPRTAGREGPGTAAEPERPLYEREQEQDVLATVLERLGRAQPSLVTVEGRPGEGRNALLRRVARRAGELGLRVLHARATRAEQELCYGAVLQLVMPLDGTVCDALRSHPPGHGPGTLPGLVEVLRSAPGTPTLLVLEDVHWLDAASREWMEALARRLYADVPIALVLSSRTATDGWSRLVPSPPSEVLVRNLTMRPLGLRSVAAVIRHVCGTGGEPSFDSAAHEATRGNPAVLHEALRVFHEKGHRPVSARLPEFRAIADEFAGDLSLRAMEELPAEAQSVMRALAVCGDVLDFPLVRTLAGPRELPERELLEVLESAGLVETCGHTARIRYPHARIRVLERMPAEERADLHVRAAALAHRAGAADEDIAAMLFRATAIGAPWVVENLQRSSTDALARGDLDHAVACLSRILLEPLEPARRARFSLELAAAEIVGSPHVAGRRLDNLVRNAGGCAAGTLVRRAIDLGLARGDDDWAARAAAEALPSAAEPAHDDLIALYWLAHRDRQDEAELMIPVVPALPETPDAPLQAGVLAWRLAVRARDLPATRTLARTCLNASAGAAPVMPRLAACRALIAAGDMDEAHSALDALIREAKRSHARAASARLLTLRAEVELRTGRLDAAERDIQDAQEALPVTSWHPAAAPQLAAVGVHVAVESGQQERARRLAQHEMPEGAENGAAWSLLLFARAMVASRDGDWAGGLRLARESGSGLLRRQWLNPALLPWRSLAARCLDALGHHDEAEQLAREESDLARDWGSAAAVGLAAVTAGPLTSDAQMARLREAAMAFEGSREMLLHTWSLVQLAQAELNAGDAPAAAGRVVRLTKVTTTYPSSRPAEAVRRLTEELEKPATPAAAEPSRTSGLLTEAERETALLAVRGHGNREIADLLSVGKRAVELRLSSVYRKLHVTGREELRAMMLRREAAP